MGACCWPCHPAQGALLASRPLQLPGSWVAVGQSLLRCFNTQRKRLELWWSPVPLGREKTEVYILFCTSLTTGCLITSSPQSPAWDPAVPGSPLTAENTAGFARHAARPAVSWEGSSWHAAVSPGLGTPLTQEPQWESYSHPGKRSETGARLCSLTPRALSVRVLLPSVLKSRSPHRSW